MVSDHLYGYHYLLMDSYEYHGCQSGRDDHGYHDDYHGGHDYHDYHGYDHDCYYYHGYREYHDVVGVVVVGDVVLVALVGYH